MIDGETHITASFNDDTPEGHMGRRRLYHTNLPEYERQRMETNRYFESPTYGSHMETTTVTKVNPKWWMKVKMFFQKINFYIEFNSEIVGTIVIAGSLTIGAILVISKILNAW